MSKVRKPTRDDVESREEQRAPDDLKGGGAMTANSVEKARCDNYRREKLAVIMEQHKAIREMMQNLEEQIASLFSEEDDLSVDSPVAKALPRKGMGTTQAAEVLGIDKTLVSRLAKAGYIPCSRPGGERGRYLFDMKDLLELKGDPERLKSYLYRARKWPHIKADEDNLVSVAEAARNLDVPARTINALIMSGRLSVREGQHNGAKGVSLVDLNEALDYFDKYTSQ